MATQKKALADYKAALDASSWENLQEAFPVIAERLQVAVEAGTTPAEIYQATIMSQHSTRLAKWCRASARHLRREAGDS